MGTSSVLVIFFVLVIVAICVWFWLKNRVDPVIAKAAKQLSVPSDPLKDSGKSISDLMSPKMKAHFANRDLSTQVVLNEFDEKHTENGLH